MPRRASRMSDQTEELVCPNCDALIQSTKTTKLPDSTVATCKHCSIKFQLGMARKAATGKHTADNELAVNDSLNWQHSGTVQPDRPPMPPAAARARPDSREANVIGIVAFVFSLTALFTTAILSVVSLVLSIIAIRKRPRGLAIAALLLSCVGVLIVAAHMLLILVVVPKLASVESPTYTFESSVIACARLSDWYEIVDYVSQGDEDAAMKAQVDLHASGQLIWFDAGDIVYQEDGSSDKNFALVRRHGDTERYWVRKVAMKPIEAPDANNSD